MIFMAPQTFLFFILYLMLLLMMSMVNSFFMFWVIMELSTLVFMGISYSVFKNNFSNLLIFFVIQAVSAFMLLIFYCVPMPFFFTISMLLKLSMFPFYFWYINLVPSFPNMIFFFTSTFFKLPSILIMYNFYNLFSLSILLFSSLFTIFIAGLTMVFSNNLRFILISSSVVNNSWFVFSQFVSLLVFMIYFMIYFMVLFMILSNLSILTSQVLLTSPFSGSYFISIGLFTLAGLPPFPIFFVKMYIIFVLVFMFMSNFYIIFLMLFSVISLLGYLKYFFSSMVTIYSNSSFLVYL